MGLGERKARILAAVVHDYVETAEPIGSEALALRYSFGVRPATIRNELAAMAEMGYLRQPHTSAGRVPSDLGYRYYVDELMPTPALDAAESDRASQVYEELESEIDIILQQTCRILSELTRYTSMATTPQLDAVRINQVALLSVGAGKLLLITVLNSGHIDHRLLDCAREVIPSDLVAISNLINERFCGADLSSFAERAGRQLPSELLRLDWIYKKAVSALRQPLSSATDQDVYVDGTANMLRQPEFAHGEKVAAIMEALEQRRSLFQMLSSALLGRDVTVLIGSENSFTEMQEFSLVASPYRVGGRACGSIGVVGPTRMDYYRAVAAVRFMASNLSSMLTALCIE